MKVFLSWSGSLSHKVACAFRDWLPSVIQSVTPYVSSEDIDKGTRWSTDIAQELEDANYGLICVTKDNVNAPWVNFEAGALSKIIDKSNVTPFLFDIKRSEVQGPLLQFQSTIYEKDDVRKLVESINKRIPDLMRLKDEQLAKAFDVWWPHLDSSLKAIIPENKKMTMTNAKSVSTESNANILEEILNLVRLQQRLLNDPESLIPVDYLQSVLGDKDTVLNNRTYEILHNSIIELEVLVTKEYRTEVELMELVSRIHSMMHELLDDRIKRTGKNNRISNKTSLYEREMSRRKRQSLLDMRQDNSGNHEP